MAIPIGSNFSLKGKLPIDERFVFDTVNDMKDYPEMFLPEGYFCMVKETTQIYVYSDANEVDEETGKWRAVKSESPRFEFEQEAPSSTWTITHSLGKEFPEVVCFDDAGSQVIGDVEYYSENVVIVKFCNELAGKAYVQ